MKKKPKKILFFSLVLILISFVYVITKTKKENHRKEYQEYRREWIKYISPNNKTLLKEFYITKKNDSISGQYKFFNDSILDLTKSNFYNLTISKKDENGIYDGQIELFSILDTIKSKLIEKDLEFVLIHIKNDSLKFLQFKSHNSNIVKFENDNDSIMGYLIETRILEQKQVGNIIDKEKKVRFIERISPIDNQTLTKNHYFKMYKIGYKDEDKSIKIMNK